MKVAQLETKVQYLSNCLKAHVYECEKMIARQRLSYIAAIYLYYLQAWFVIPLAYSIVFPNENVFDQHYFDWRINFIHHLNFFFFNV